MALSAPLRPWDVNVDAANKLVIALKGALSFRTP
jgi:hypothetical protein